MSHLPLTTGLSANDKVCVRGHVHTCTVRRFWSPLKDGIGRVCHPASRKYLQPCLNEYCFRYNRRSKGNQQFQTILERVSRKAS
jgi:hypothetical protein